MRTINFPKRIILLGVFACIFLIAGCGRQPYIKKQIYVVFRFDDYSATSATDMELKLIEVFHKSEASITFGVIPFAFAGNWANPMPGEIAPMTSMKGDILKAGIRDGILDIAMHGYSHQSNNHEDMTEFSGLDYISQVERLTKGKNLLESMLGLSITSFIPPWNKYDVNTLRALEEVGFLTLSADRKGTAIKESKLNFLPVTCNLSQLQDSVITARASSDYQPMIVVLFHAYDLKTIDDNNGGITSQELSERLNWLKSQDDVQVLSISQATQVIQDLGVDRYLSNRRNYLQTRLLPPSLREKTSMLLYRESHSLQKTLLLVKVVGFYLVIIILGAALSFLMGIIVFRRSAFLMNITTFGSIALSVILVIYLFHDPQVHLKGLILVVSSGIVGLSIGFFSCFLYLKKKQLCCRNSMG